jgi:hypothetical protein
MAPPTADGLVRSLTMKISPAPPHRSRRGFLTAALSSTLGMAALTACGSDDRPAARGSTLTPLRAGAYYELDTGKVVIR